MPTSPIASRAPLAVAVLAVAAFGNGEHSDPIAAWLAPVLMLRFVRDASTWRGLIAAWLIAAAVWAWQWHAVFRAQGVELAIGALLFSGLGLLPYLVDRRWARRLPPLVGTLVFPAALVSFELLLAKASPFGAWGMLAYTQADVLPLAQLAALTGMAGITFIVAWLAPVANLAWEEARRGSRWRRPAAAFACAIALVLGAGTLRLGQVAPSGDPVRIALVRPPLAGEANYDAGNAPALADALFEGSEQAALAGAQIVAWPEDSFFVSAVDAVSLHARASEFAARHRVHLAIAYGEREKEGSLRYRNTSMLFAPDGAVAWRYAKSHAVPGYEERNMIRGDGRMASVDTPFGRVAGMICFDADHGGMLAQLDARHGLLILPSDDWPAIAWLHAAMVRLRAIEQGVAIARPTINGRSVVYDALGRSAGELPPGSDAQVLDARVTVVATATPYARSGDVFAWACVALLVLSGALARRGRANRLSPVMAESV